MTEQASREELAGKIDAARWEWLKPHCDRGVVITVSGGLDLAEAGWRIARDEATVVAQWVASGLVGKPTQEQVADWDLTPEREFPMLVVSPYVLMGSDG
jgi:hypothetical protein